MNIKLMTGAQVAYALKHVIEKYFLCWPSERAASERAGQDDSADNPLRTL
jgi:hypothetical protein